jgi:hypothetical protein
MKGYSPLTAYALAGLRRCWMADMLRWSHKYHLDGRREPNESLPHSDVYYSLNVLLGLARVRRALTAESYEIPLLFKELCQTSIGQPMRNGAWGMALWAAAELDLDPPGAVAGKLRGLCSDLSAVVGWTAQDVGLSLTGVTAQASREPSWRPLAHALRDVLLSDFRGPGALFRDSGRGPRRHFGTFATQVYAALSLYQYGELSEDIVAIEAANACVTRLLTLQGAMGEWPWFYWPRQDRVLDRYEVYSVHQYGMGPALLHHAVQHQVPGAREAIVKGFKWIFGTNEMAISMLVPTKSLIYRSQARRGIHGRRDMRLLRAAVAAATGGGGDPTDRSELRLTQEMRSYEYGWLLWSFGSRDDYSELTHHTKFNTRN